MPGNNLTGLVEAIHGAAFDETRWPSILEHVADALGSRNASMVRANRTTGQAQAIAVGLDPSAHGLFVGYYSKRNPLPQHSEIDDAFGRRAVVARAHVRELLLRSEYHNDFLKPFGMAHLAWVFLDRDGTDVAMLNVGRPERLDAYDRSDLERFTWLMPHLMRSYAIGRRLGGLGAAGGTLVQYLNGLPHGVVLLDAFGRIMHANRSAEIIASTADGLTFTRDGLLAATPVANTVLCAAIARAADPRHPPQAARSLALPRPSGARPLAVAVCPFGNDLAPLLFARPSVLVEIRDLAAADPPAEAWLADCLDLTPAEARVAVLLLAGLDRRAIAGRLGIADNTVRVHLARLMSKTETHRQAELVHLLGQVAALQRSAPIR